MDEKAKNPEHQSEADQKGDPQSSAEHLVKVVDRHGNVKTIPRSQYERKKRSRKKRGSRKIIPYGQIFSILLIVTVMILAVYIALKIVQ